MGELDKQNDIQSKYGSIDDEWQSITRSIRISGKVTSVRLENIYWRVLNEIANSENLQLSQLMTKLSRLSESSMGKHANFASFIRVCCASYVEQNGRSTVSGNSVTGSERSVEPRKE